MTGANFGGVLSASLLKVGGGARKDAMGEPAKEVAMSLRRLIVASVLICALCSPAASGPNEGFQPNTDRPGNDFVNLAISDAESCQEACRTNERCRAWAWVKPGIMVQRRAAF
jgi:PAN domain